MRLLRLSLIALALAGAPAALLVPTDARASVSIAVGFDALVKDADSVVVITPVESKSLWEEGRIYTYTKVKVDQGIAGDLGTGAEGWVRTMGGVVGKIGQLVDGEPVLVGGKQSLLFLRKFQTGGTFEVSARAQGQYPVILDDSSKTKKVIKSANVGVLFPPKSKDVAEATAHAESAGPPTADSLKVRLASDVIHDRPLDDVTRDIAAAWKKAHPAK